MPIKKGLYLIKFIHRRLIRISIVLYFFSLVLPVFFFRDMEPIYGYDVLLFGWLGLFTLNFGWFANLFSGIALTLFLFAKKKFAFVISILGVIIALDVLRTNYWYFGDSTGTPFVSPVEITSHGLGFYFWVTAICFLPFAIYFYRESINQNH